MKRAILIATLLSFITVPAFAEGDYVYILKARNNPYWQAVVDGISETASKEGIKAKVYQIENETAAEEQLNVCMAALETRPLFLAISSVTSAIGVSCMKEATARGVIVADMDANILPKDAQKAGFNLAFSVGSDNYLIGKTAAEYLARIASKQDLKILILEGSVGSVPGNKRVGGFKDGVASLLPKAYVVASISADWDRLKAMNIVADFLQREQKIDVIYTANDQMALGAVEALRSTRRQKHAMIIGVDGTADGRKAILAGTLTASVAQLPYYIGMRAVQKAKDVINYKATEPVEATPTPVLTKEMIEANDNPLLQYVR